MSRTPVLFIAHGAPPLLDDAAWMAELAAWGKALPRPTAILMISAHWEARPATLGATRAVPLVYDYYGFPERFYRIKYPAPGAPAVAARVRTLLGAAGFPTDDEPDRGLDHGVFVPMIPMWPDASIPTLQLSMPSLDPGELFRMGQALAPLRDEGVLIVGSGFLTHNLRRMGEQNAAWAKEFDGWVAGAIAGGDTDALIDFARKGPAAQLAHPRTEHYVPVVVAAGAARESLGQATFPITGWAFGPFTKRSVQWG